ncbi:MAG TPA: hypothetical protein DF984_01815 [Anaerolineaceae bacterium]|jgi:hypothetical protein|nr:hypothetical protein [Anaerolineaceae bacterium]
MGNKKLGLASTLIICILLVGIFGTSVAFAASGYEEVGGGIWTWNTIPGFYAKSNYFHREAYHRASAQVGAGDIISDIQPPNVHAVAIATGLFGTCRVWWYVY